MIQAREDTPWLSIEYDRSVSTENLFASTLAGSIKITGTNFSSHYKPKSPCEVGLGSLVGGTDFLPKQPDSSTCPPIKHQQKTNF
jgi:hypothetical protein